MRHSATPALLLALLGGLSLPATGCSSDDEVRPSPIPPGYAMLLRQREGQPSSRPASAQGETVDEMLAVVDGTVLTRREVMRRLRLPEGEVPDAQKEQEISRARLEWARQRIVNAAARREGLRIPPSFIDKHARESLEKQRKAFEEQSGTAVTAEEYLAGQNLTWPEFRNQVNDSIVYRYYLTRLLQGAGEPTRPQIDYAISPAEVRRVYYDNKKEFDVKRGVKFALLQMRTERFETDERDFLEAEDLAVRYARQIAQEFREGATPQALASRYRIAEADWTSSEDFVVDFPHPDGKAWLFDPARRAPDALVLDDPAGPLVVMLQEVRAARARDLEEVYEDIVRFVQSWKERRLEAQLITEEIQRGGTVWPDDLVDELLDYAQAIRDEIAVNPVLGGTRLE
jgi:hypothetical protein